MAIMARSQNVVIDARAQTAATTAATNSCEPGGKGPRSMPPSWLTCLDLDPIVTARLPIVLLVRSTTAHFLAEEVASHSEKNTGYDGAFYGTRQA